MIYTILVFGFFVVVYGLDNYLKKSDALLNVKIMHLIITFLLFDYYFSTLRNMLWGLIRDGKETFYTSINFLYYSKTYDLITSILFFLLSSFVAGLSLNLAVKAKSRTLLLYFSPVIAIITGLHLYKSVLKYMEYTGDIYLFLITMLLVIIVFGLIDFFYTLKPVKKMFMLN